MISLRTASVSDDGNLVGFDLMPADLTSLVPAKGEAWNFDWLSQDGTWLYRHLRSDAEELKLMHRWPSVVDQDIKPMAFERLPVFKLLWKDSGHSVALYLNGQPWAFIDENTHVGYSKGVLKPMKSARSWDQRLFEGIFEQAA